MHVIDKRVSASAPGTLIASRGAAVVPAIKLACLQFPENLAQGVVPYDTLIYQSGSIGYVLYTPDLPPGDFSLFPHITFLVAGIYHVTASLWMGTSLASGAPRPAGHSQSTLYVSVRDAPIDAPYIGAVDSWTWGDPTVTDGWSATLSVSFDMPADVGGNATAIFLTGAGTAPNALVAHTGTLATSMQAHYVGPKPPSFEFFIT